MAHERSVTNPTWTRAAAAEVVARWEASGQSCRAFCAEHGVDLKRFYRWRRVLRPPPAPDERAPPGFALAVSSPGVRVRVACGAIIEIAPGFDGRLLREVLAALC
jgi:transposase-like protein